ncbi:hypothetical protein HHK36_009211 [Tetracentron sinense]|uniref:Uncharacterized protein n=1 Tax=Tetracentron sinense TaxID=13715 RepID=A0A835DHA4_TETSI|nr:hypothetical protein HHK36_009211 [Tetracentron sinense]
MERLGQHEETIALGTNSRLLAETESARLKCLCSLWEGFWKNLVENQDRRWDNRSIKFNKISPDFKHTDTCEGLWLDCSPARVLPKLPPATKPKQDGVVGKRDTFLSNDFKEAI